MYKTYKYNAILSLRHPILQFEFYKTYQTVYPSDEYLQAMKACGEDVLSRGLFLGALTFIENPKNLNKTPITITNISCLEIPRFKFGIDDIVKKSILEGPLEKYKNEKGIEKNLFRYCIESVIGKLLIQYYCIDTEIIGWDSKTERLLLEVILPNTEGKSENF